VKVVAGPSIRRPGVMSPSAAFLERIRATGATVVQLADPDSHPLPGAAPRGLAFGWTPRRFTSGLAFKGIDLALISRWSAAWAEGVTAELDREVPDVVVADFFLFGALAAGEAAGLPTAALVHNASLFWPIPGRPPPGSGFGPPHNWLERLRDAVLVAAWRRVAVRDGLQSVNDARRQVGLTALRSPYQQYDSAARLLILGSEAFDFPSGCLPANARYVGTPFDDVAPPDWSSPWPPDDPAPLVLASLSTLAQGQAPVMHQILAALDGMAVRGLVTLGPALDASEFRVPPNVRLEAFVAHGSVLPYVDAIVTQCGLSTVTKALAHGVPLICIPVIGEQRENAARIVALGAGIRLIPSASSDEIRTAIDGVLSESRFREAAQRAAVEFRGENGADLAAAELESLVPPGGAA
jgi:UDP:flavonoid glycosyltransferase YjiC (YdhE family)